MYKKLIEVLEKEMLTEEEFEFVSENEDVEKIESNGTSGRFVGKTWYTVYLTNDEEYDVYET